MFLSAGETDVVIKDKTGAIQDRYYNYLNKLQKKQKPNPESLKMYMDLDFENRRGFLKSLVENRTETFFGKYPVFLNNHTQVFIICFLLFILIEMKKLSNF